MTIVNMTGKKCDTIVYHLPYVSPPTALSRSLAVYYNPSVRMRSAEHVKRDVIRIATETYERAMKKDSSDPSKQVLLAANIDYSFTILKGFFESEGWEVIPIHLKSRSCV